MIAVTALAWADACDACQDCGRRDQPHHARGLCQRCYARQAMQAVREARRADYNAYHQQYQREWRTRPSFEATLAATDEGRANHARLGLRCCSREDYALWLAAARRSGMAANPGTLGAFCRDCILMVREEMTQQGRCVRADREMR